MDPLTVSLPTFLAGNEDPSFTYLAGFLRNSANRESIHMYLRTLLKEGVITLKTNHLLNNIAIPYNRYDCFSTTSAQATIAYYQPSVGEILAHHHQMTRRGLRLAFPKLPCIRVLGGLIKKLRDKNIFQPHISVFPMELLNVTMKNRLVQADHAYRWGPKPSSSSRPTSMDSPAKEPRMREPTPNLISLSPPPLLRSFTPMSTGSRPKTPPTPTLETLERRLTTPGGFGTPESNSTHSSPSATE